MKIVACLVFASVLSVAPALAMAQDIVNPLEAAPIVAAEDIAPATQDVVDASPSTDNLAASVIEGQDIAITAVAVEETPVVEVVTSQALAATSAAAELTPAVDVATSQDDSVTAFAEPAPAAPSTEEQVVLETTDLGVVNDMIAKLDIMHGKDVFDQNGAMVGTVVGMDDETNLAEVQLMTGETIAVMPESLTDMGFGVIANDLSCSEVVTAANQTESAPVSTIVSPE